MEEYIGIWIVVFLVLSYLLYDCCTSRGESFGNISNRHRGYKMFGKGYKSFPRMSMHMNFRHHPRYYPGLHHPYVPIKPGIL